jgi:hypothetical protein
MRVTAKLDLREFDAAIARLKAAVAPRVVASAVTRAGQAGHTQLVRDTSRDMKLKQATVKARTSVSVASATNPAVTISASAKPTPAIEFGARGPEPSRGQGRGVTANLPARRFPRAFITRVGRGGHRGVFERVGKARLPIREIKGPSVWFVASKHVAAAARRAGDVMRTRLQHEIQRALKAR